MGYREETIARLGELIKEIQGRKEHPNAAMTYRDVPALQEIERILCEQLAKEHDRDTLSDSIILLRLLAKGYESMGRFSLCANYYVQIFPLALELKSVFGEDIDDIEDIFYATLRAKNAYVDDDCQDIVEVAEHLIPEQQLKDMLAFRMKNRRNLVRDSVEMSEEYLAVIDEIEEKLQREHPEKMRGMCYLIWEQKRQYLKAYGMEWHSPAQLNPGIHFD